MITVTMPRTHINLDAAILPSELMIKDTLDVSRPAWLVQRLRTHVTTVCDTCGKHIGSLDYAYYEQGYHHPAHPSCWILALPSRPIRVVSVRYNR